MVRAPATGPSRAASSRATSVARDILKKREKPYKTEFQKIMGKKRKLNINTSYRKAPKGYTYLPVGTPDLADLCKKLSKERDLPVNVVNAKPTSRVAEDPTKLSHHVHRIGYHFHSDVLEQAVAQLNYTIYKGRFVKEEDLAKEQQKNYTAQILAKHGVNPQNRVTESETPDQVRAAIKELFPKIPDIDLEEIVKHAWEEGTGRVGRAEALDLSRRVQLAVIARIRHEHTDYDRLLRAFEWAEARKMTEPVSLQKLIEWRGEQDVEDDDGLEEIVRETIVIDDDDEGDDSVTLANGSEADDEDSADHSDASIEVTRHLADDTDIGAESSYESRHPLVRRFQPVPRRSQRQQQIAKQKLAEARRFRAVGEPAISSAHQDVASDRVLTHLSSIETVHVPGGANGATSSFERDGVVYHPVETPRYPGLLWEQRLSQPQQGGLYDSQHAPRVYAAPSTRGEVYQTNSRYVAPLQDRPVASIERGDDLDVPGAGNSYRHLQDHGSGRSRPNTPNMDNPSKRRRLGQRDQYAQHGSNGLRAPLASSTVIDLTTPEQPRHGDLAPFGRAQVVDLMTPEPLHQPAYPSPLQEVRSAAFGYGQVQPQAQSRFLESQVYAPFDRPSPMRISPPKDVPTMDAFQGEAASLAYDPTQPMLHLPSQVGRLSIRPDHHLRSPYGGIPGAYPPSPAPPPPQPPQQPLRYYEVSQSQPTAYQPNIQPQPQLSYPSALPPRILYEQQQPARPNPQPVHGAPAPVQVIPRHTHYGSGYGRPPPVPPPPPPTDGAPHPAQMYYPR